MTIVQRVRRETAIVGAALAAIALLILGSATLCTWAIGEGASPRWRLPFRLLCHGMPSRSFELFGATMPICARCTGVYLGLLAAPALFAFLPRLNEGVLRIGLFAAAMPMAIDGVTQAMRFRESTNGLRIVTGIVAAFAFGLWALSELERAVKRRSAVP